MTSVMAVEKTYDIPSVGCLLGSAYQRLTSQLEAALKRDGLKISTAEYMILRALYFRDGLQQCEIAEMIGKDKSSICRSVSSLVRKGLVFTNPVSYKCIQVFITDEARNIKPRIMKIARRRDEALRELASESEISNFTRILKAIVM